MPVERCHQMQCDLAMRIRIRSKRPPVAPNEARRRRANGSLDDVAGEGTLDVHLQHAHLGCAARGDHVHIATAILPGAVRGTHQRVLLGDARIVVDA